MENILIRKQNKLNIKKFDFQKLILYFAFYSFIGFCFESIFGIFSKGVLESRQSFIFGPFCAIYGIGAILMIYLLEPFKKNTFIIFFGSSIIGAFSEYFMSYLCELYFHFKWWDYSYNFLNINGRTCLVFAIIWGVLGFLLIKYVHPKVDAMIEKIRLNVSTKVFNFTLLGLTIFLFIDIFLSTVALKYLYAKISNDYNLPQTEYSTQKLSYFTDTEMFSTDNLLKIYPNIRIAGTRMNNIFVDSLYKPRTTYYIKFFNKDYY